MDAAHPAVITRQQYIFGDASLTAECQLVGTETGWHVWFSDAGVIHATTRKCPGGGSGTTLTAGTPEQMRRVVAETEHEWKCAEKLQQALAAAWTRYELEVSTGPKAAA